MPGLLETFALLVGIACISFAGWNYVEALREQQRITASFAAAKLKTMRAPPSLPPQQIEQINRAIQQLNLPWDELLLAVERHVSKEVALISLNPDATKEILRIEGEARSPNDMVDFVESINHDDFFVSAVLLHHQINEADRNRPYRFTLEAQWQPAI